MQAGNDTLYFQLLLGATLPVALAALTMGTVFLLRADRCGKLVGSALVSVSLWLAGACGEQLSTGLDPFVLSAKIKMTGVAATPVFLLLFFLEYFFPGRISLRGALALGAVPSLTVLLIWTNESHGWLWTHPPVGADGGFLLRPDWNWYFWWIHTPYSYMAGITCLLVTLVRLSASSALGGSRREHRTQTLLLLGALAIPLLANMAYLVAGVGDSPYSYSHFATAAGVILLTVAYLRIRSLGLQPITHRRVLDQMEEGVLVLDRLGRVVEANRAAGHLLGCPTGRIVGRPLARALDGAPDLLEAVENAPGRTEIQLREPERLLTVAVSSLSTPGRKDEDRAGIVVVLRDITAERLQQKKVRETESLLRGILERSSNGVLRGRPLTDEAGEIRDFRLIFANPVAVEILALEDADENFLLSDLRTPNRSLLFSRFSETVRTGERLEIELPAAAGDRWFRILADEIEGDLSVTLIDVTEQRSREQWMMEAAYTDSLTGLANRRAFHDHGNELVAVSRRDGRPISLLFLDLDDFKLVNDRHGHETGDLVLRNFAEALIRCVRTGDLVARIGGDEFVVLLPRTAPATAGTVAKRIRVAAGQVGAGGEPLSLSIGTASTQWQESGKGDLDDLLAAADDDMYRSKRGARSDGRA